MRPRKIMAAALAASMLVPATLVPVTGNVAWAAPATARPNVIVIVLDDVGFSDLGTFGSEIRTPNIDALAADGLRYNRFDTKAVCSPTRAALLTGRNAQTVRMADLPTAKQTNDTTKDRGEIPGNAQMLAQAMRQAGYATMAMGKWHLSPEYEDGTPGNNASWPLQRGFDRFYGFISGWTDQYHPALIEGNRPLPKVDRPGYHLSADLVDRTISEWDAQKRGAPTRPVFTYLALGAAHAPIQVPRSYIDAYAGVYEAGWDRLRKDRIARMRRSGIIPADTALPPRNGGDRAWASLSATERQVFARFMATYAGLVTHADEQIGRLVAHLKKTGAYDNTMIVLLSDNGAAGEANQTGAFDGLYRPNKLTPEQMLARLDELGTDRTQAEYQRPWAMLGVTPFRRYKVWPYAGGVRTPLIISWPQGIRDRGAVRTQYVDVVDLAPTIVDVARGRFAQTVNGVRQIPVAGRSIRASFARADAPSARSVQFFELRGNRAITQGKWRAVAMHRNGTDFSGDRWELFDTSNDFSESRDLSKQYPAKLKELQALWAREAGRYSKPALSEAPERFRGRERFGDAFLEPKAD
ncbi:arylsulfatase [Sphingomonas panni]|uniref:arylsulfatase n=1 Tax=Sphingomonas panni TaxID=237612 RepID=UPI001F5B071D|nr:arylsulfatase [Sphingomonas panni]